LEKGGKIKWSSGVRRNLPRGESPPQKKKNKKKQIEKREKKTLGTQKTDPPKKLRDQTGDTRGKKSIFKD